MTSNITSEYYEERRAWKRNFLLIYFSETSNSPSCYVVPSFPSSLPPRSPKVKKIQPKENIHGSCRRFETVSFFAARKWRKKINPAVSPLLPPRKEKIIFKCKIFLLYILIAKSSIIIHARIYSSQRKRRETIRNISHSPSDENRWNFHYFIYFSPFPPPPGGKAEGKGMVGSTLARSPHTFSSMCGLFRNCSAGEWWWVRGKFAQIFKYKTDVRISQEKILSWSKYRQKTRYFLWQIPRRAKKGINFGNASFFQTRERKSKSSWAAHAYFEYISHPEFERKKRRKITKGKNEEMTSQCGKGIFLFSPPPLFPSIPHIPKERHSNSGIPEFLWSF